MRKEILYTTAIDKNGNLIHIDMAENGMNYYCPICKQKFILRKSGKTGKGSRRAHFSHNELSPNCTPEGVLHYSFKKMLISLLGKYKAENKPLIFNWGCHSCNYKNTGNLLGKVALIKSECYLGQFRPDIALLDEEENVLAVIELVVTHKPEESVLQYYKERKIILVQINLTSEEDLKNVENKIKKPDIVDLCLSTECQNRDEYKINRNVVVSPLKCGRCLGILPKFEVQIDSAFGRQLSRDFAEDEISLVKSKYSYIEVRKDPATGKRHPIAECMSCKMMRSRYSSPRL